MKVRKFVSWTSLSLTLAMVMNSAVYPVTIYAQGAEADEFDQEEAFEEEDFIDTEEAFEQEDFIDADDLEEEDDLFESEEAESALAAAENELTVDDIVVTQEMFGNNWYISFTDNEFFNALTKVTVNGEVWTEKAYSVYAGGEYHKDTRNNRLTFCKTIWGSSSIPVLSDGDKVVFSAEGYAPLSVVFSEQDGEGKFIAAEEDETIVPETPEEPAEKKTISADQAEIASDFFGTDWYLTFKDADDYVAAIKEIKVNDVVWEKSGASVYTGGKYQVDTSNNRLVFVQKQYSSSGAAVLKSGDTILISAEGYEDLALKFIIDDSGQASLTAGDEKGDPYKLFVKIDGTFDAAITGQSDYDAITGASGSVSDNNNSAVDVYVALTEEEAPAEEDWKKVGDLDSKIRLDGNNCSVRIRPDVENGTDADSDSGMQGIFMTLSSGLTLIGTPKDAGRYLISVSVTDDQGRVAESNELPFRVYSGKVKLVDQLVLENFVQTADGKYMWDMNPWSIAEFGSNVPGEENSIRVPVDLKAWYGSHESGTYGYLGGDLPWDQVIEGSIPQTLYIPSGCNLTMVNMEILSNVRIVVESGGKLTLRDSVVQGIVDVESNGKFSMNYNDFENGGFLTGASINGQLRLADGAILENASIYSHTNYIANGSLADRMNTEPVVVMNGNVAVKGQVFIKGDSAADDIGQTALRVNNGTITLDDGGVLVLYGGEGKIVPGADGGVALELNNAHITGGGKIVAIGGNTLWGDGGNAVIGSGSIDTPEAFLKGAAVSNITKSEPGKAIADGVSITSAKKEATNGIVIGFSDTDPLASLNWLCGVDATPPLDQFTIAEKTDDQEQDQTSEEDKKDIEAFVNRLYQTCLGREADDKGLAYWTTALENKNKSGFEVAKGFIYSNEFQKKDMTDEEYINCLYQAFFGRKPEQGGVDYWIQQLEKGKTRDDIFLEFADSKEFDQICKDYGIVKTFETADKIEEFIIRLYNGCLNRKPDTDGLKDWSEKLRDQKETGSSVAKGFIFSNEFKKRDYNDEEFIEYLYKGLFGRSSDATGKAYWMKEMEKGKTREQVFDGFVQSKEFKALCESYNIVIK